MEMPDEIVREFLVESYENLDQLDHDLVALEETPEDRDRLSSVFRAIHTIKGTSGFLAYPKLEHVAHVGENLLVPLRDGDLRLSQDIADGLLSMVDAVRSILGNIETTAGEGDDEYTDLVRRLEQLRNGELECESGQTATATAAEVPPGEENAVEDVVRELTNQTETSPEDAAPEQADASAAAEAGPACELPPLNPGPAATAEKTPPKAETPVETPERGQSIAESTVRIDVSVLDRLMNLVGELVLARNQIMQYSHDTEDSSMIAASQRLNLITTELQEGVMKTRMQPIRNAWGKLPRVVRDLSLSCGKQVQVKMEGEDTELDKTIVEAIKDPLTHIVRNSVDHGIESPEERLAAGKPAEGTLWLRAYHEGGQVNIEISDDGAGINVERVRAKAVEKGLVTQEQADAMGDREVTQLILLPGFSTAAQVTNVSGRGVGMDVVRTNVEKIGGTLDIHSTSGQGTSLRIKIPLTLAIVPALTVTCDNDRYCIPQVSLLELVRLDEERVKTDIELMHSVPVYRLRGELLPLVYLDEQLGLHPQRSDAERRTGENVNIVVLQSENQQFGLVVDQINDTQEIVVKPLGQHLRGVDVYAGSTIMGDGAVSLILDVMGIARQGGVLTEHTGHQFLDDDPSGSGQVSSTNSHLVVDPGDGTRSAIPLSSVARLEQIRVDRIEQAGRQQVVQYRGEIMPLIQLDGGGYGGQQTPDEDAIYSVVVFSEQGRSVGVVVSKIIDIVESLKDADDGSSTQVIAGRVTQMLDPTTFLHRGTPQFDYQSTC